MALRRPVTIAAVAALAVPLLGSGAAHAEPAPTLTGTVALAGTPVAAGVHVGWFDPDRSTAGPLHEGRTTTRADGSYTLPLPSDGRPYLLFAGVEHADLGSAPDLPGTVATYVGPAGAAHDHHRLAAFTSGPAERTLAITLDRSARISGRAAAIAGRTVSLRTLGGTDAGAVRADAAGAFALDVVPGSFRVVVAGDATHLPWTSPVVVPDRAHPAVVHPVVRAAPRLRGRATVGSRPARNVRVVAVAAASAQAGAGDARGPLSTSTDTSGRWSLRLPTTGDWSVLVGRVGGAGTPAAQVPRRVAVRAVRAGETRFLATALTVAGRITGSFAAPRGATSYRYVVSRGTVTGPVVAAGSGAVRSPASRNAIGATGLAAGTYVVQAVGRGSSSRAVRTVTVRPGRTTSLGTLRTTAAALTLRGSSAPLAGGSIVLEQPGTSSGTEVPVPSSGSWRISGLLPGRYVATALRQGHVGAAHPLTLTGDAVRDYASPGPPVASATGTVDLPEGRGLPTALLRLSGTGYFVRAQDHDLLLSPLQGLRAGTYAVRSADVESDDLRFPYHSPYFLAVPDGLTRLVLRPGGNDLGHQRFGIEG